VDAHPDYLWVPFTILKPDPRAEEPYGNIHVDMDWLKKHLLGGVDDPSVTPRPVEPAPLPSPSTSARPVPRPSGSPAPRPTASPVPGPSARPTPAPPPAPGPTSSPSVVPR
jgi:hypothetical protein